MGNQSQSQTRLVPNSLTYYTTINHNKHKTVAIYTSKLLPMTFIMKLQRNILRSRLFHFFQQITNQNSPYLATLYGFKIQRNENCTICTRKQSIPDQTVQYWQYLNYSLYHHINDRIRRRSSFTQHQIWHVLQVILESLKILDQYGLYWQVNPQYLLITPQGKLKCQWSMCQLNIGQLQYQKTLRERLRQNNEQSCFTANQSQIKQSMQINQEMQFKSPEEIGDKQTANLNLQKCNVYKIGLLILNMLTMQYPNVTNLNNLIAKLTYQSQQKVHLKLYWNFLTETLKPNPHQRCSIEQLQNYCHHFYCDQYELLINEGKKQDLQQYNMQAQIKLQKKHQQNNHLQTRYQKHRRFAYNLQDNPTLKINHINNHNKSKRETLSTLMDRASLLKQKPSSNLQKRMIELRQHRKEMLKNEYKFQ